ncbi:unnamed protein product [Effrenium voratum]|nr:unnamed protein product [Effrenium voratum]
MGVFLLAETVEAGLPPLGNFQEAVWLFEVWLRLRGEAFGAQEDNSVCDSGAAALYNACGQRLQLKLRCNSVPLQQLLELQEELQARLEEEHAAALERKVAGSAKKPKKRRSRTSSSAVGSP